jgi:hypothetical protein
MGVSPLQPTVLILRANERLKLIASALNNLGLAFIVAGYIGPVVTGSVPGSPRAIVVIAWLAFGIGLQSAGLWVLGRLRG